MTTMIPDLVVGAVGFGDNGDFYASPVDATPRIEELEAEVAELVRQRNALRRVLERCAALSPEISDLKHEVLLETAPKKH